METLLLICNLPLLDKEIKLIGYMGDFLRSIFFNEEKNIVKI